MRPWLVQQVASDLIGPRGGLFESLGRDRRPDLEYSIGILAPPEERQLESDLSQDQLEDEKSGEEDTGSSKAQEPVAFSPGLDPKSYPPSLGLSFTCRSESETPRFDIAISYARYNSSEQGYSREPRACVLPVEEIRSSLAASGKAFRGSVYLRTGPLEEPGSRTLEACAKGPVSESRVSLVMRPSSGDLWTVSIFLTTDLEMPDGPFDLEARCEAKIFQPEIRIRMRDGTEASEEFGPKTVAGEELTEEAIDRELYRGRGQVARGHLCSAMWKEHDPQVISDEDTARISAEMEKFGQSFSLAPPFHWVDSTHPAFASDLEGFYPPDIRTEYMPLLNLPAPEMNPGEDSIPAIGASQLAEAVSGGEIRRILEPLLDWYSGWIEDSFDSEGNPMHGELKARAETSLARMKKGVEMLARDDQARLAFNMANKAIHLSNHWQSDGKWDFVWRKFQIAFVLLAIESTSRRGSPDRRQLDLLWVATGGGKTEAYLLLMAYLLCLRRLRPGLDSGVEETHWQGVNVITRYTLRLLTIQQFRRTLGVITAMEWLRAQNEESGWAPEGIQLEANPWGIQPFGIGIWVGGAVTPNNLGKVTKRGKTNRIGIIKGFNDRYFNPGLMDALHGLEAGDALSDAMAKQASEPAQVIFCPCCRATLSFPRASDDSPSENDSTIHWVIQSRDHPSSTVERMLRDPDLSEIVRSADLVDHDNGHYTLSIDVTMESGVHERSVEKLWKDILSLSRNSFEYSCARPSRPGYFYISKEVRGGNFQYTDFVIHCPDPQCPLNQTEWEGRLPAGRAEGKKTQRDRPEPRPEGFQIEIPGPWRKDSNPYLSRGIPIPACTVDEQVYSRLPSVVISTVDKFARLPFEPRAGGMFGNVDHHHDVHGFIRAGAQGKNPSDLKDENCRIVPLPGGLASPDLIIQDELHLIEGPLGSMVGFYETVVEALIKEGLPPDTAPKYVASTATIRSADPQVQCLFNRKVTLFPPKGPTWSDRGMIREVLNEPAYSDGDKMGRLYAGLCPIGPSGLGFQRDLYASVLHASEKLVDTDRYWTVAGYYNAVRELAGARALMDQDVLGALQRLSLRDETASPRPIDNLLELSSRRESTELPMILDRLENLRRGDPGAVDVLLTTAMFGTGVDVDRLNLMVVAGQPKTTAQYIQATGRVGRGEGALVTTYLRASRPRDLDHYERFLAYHLRIHSEVEPVTVRPFALPVISKAAGPLMVGWLRNSRLANTLPWRTNTSSGEWMEGMTRPPEFDAFIDMLMSRNGIQVEERRIDPSPPNAITNLLEHGQHRWATISSLADDEAVLDPQKAMRWTRNPFNSLSVGSNVVLGGEEHVKNPTLHTAVYSPDHPAPQSLRAVDSTVGVKTRGRD